MTTLGVQLLGVGVLGPGIASWPALQEMLCGRAAHATAPTALPAPQRLPMAERRRAGSAIKLAMAVADAAVAHAGIDPQQAATVFASSSGDGANCHALCEALAGADRLISPTRFTNSVHNATAGYWHIAVASRAPSTSVGAFDDSFAAGLLEAAVQVQTTQQTVLLVASDTAYPEPLNAARPLADAFGVAFVLAPLVAPRALAVLDVELVEAAQAGPASACRDASLEALRRSMPAARALPLLQALALGDPCLRLVLDCVPALKLVLNLRAP